MSLAFDIAPILERLRQEVPALRVVAGAAELAAAVESGKGLQTPCAFVTLTAERGSPMRGVAGVFVQPVQLSVSVMLVVRNYTRASLGSAARADLLPVLQDARNALLGWKPAGADDVLTFSAGRVFDFDAGTLWWEDVLATRYTIAKKRGTP